MGDGTLALEVVLDFAEQGFDLWSEYLGSNILSRAANTTWKRMTHCEVGAGRVTEALTRIFPGANRRPPKIVEPANGISTLVWSHFDVPGFGVCPGWFKLCA